jgi:hypothetical protein
MNESDSERLSLKFWIAALAFSLLLTALTFTLISTYLADIRNNTSAALLRAEVVTERLDTLNTEVLDLHRHMVAEKTPAGTASGIEVPIANPAAPTPSANPELPPIQAPTLAEPTKENVPVTPPPATVPPAATSAAPLVTPPAAKP